MFAASGPASWAGSILAVIVLIVVDIAWIIWLGLWFAEKRLPTEKHEHLLHPADRGHGSDKEKMKMQD